MIIELAKDKSLKTVLLKSKVDENTMALVKSDASISLIKNSLVENINGNNIVQYRRYIRKAEEEEAQAGEDFASEETESEARAEAESEAEQAAQNPEDLDRDDTVAETAGDLTAELQGKKDKTKKRTEKQKEYGKYNREIKRIMKMLSATQTLSEKLSVEEVDRDEKTSGYEFRGQDAYAVTFNSQSESNSYLNLIKILQRDDNYLVSKYKRHYNASGKFMLDAKEETEGSGKEVDIRELTQSLLEVADSTVEVENSQPINFIKAFVALHTNTWDRQPSAYRSVGRYNKEVRSAISRLRGEPQKDDRFNRAVTKLNKIRKYADSLESKREYISSALAELEVIERDGGDKVVGRKISKLVAALKELQSSEIQGAAPKGISQSLWRNLDMGKRIRGLNEIMVQIQTNSSKYIDEAVRELQQDIEEEREKLSTVEREIERVNQYLPQLQQLTSLLERYTRRSRYQSSGDSLTERQQYRERFKERDERLRSHLSRLFNTLSELDDNLKKMSKRIDKLDEFTAREFTEWISGEAGRRPRLTATEIENFAQFEGGFDTYNNDDIRQIEQLGARIEGNYERIEHWIGSFGTELRRRIYDYEGGEQ
jgi:hypothetical protein